MGTEAGAGHIRRGDIVYVVKYSLCSGVRAVPQWVILSMAGFVTGTVFFPLSGTTPEIVIVVLSISIGILFAFCTWFLRRHFCRPVAGSSEFINRLTVEERDSSSRHHPEENTAMMQGSAQGGERRVEEYSFFEDGGFWILEIIPAIELLFLGALVLLAPHIVGCGSPTAPTEWTYPVESTWKVFLMHLWFSFAVNMRCAVLLVVGSVHLVVLVACFRRIGTMPVVLSAISIVMPILFTTVVGVRAAFRLRELRDRTPPVEEGDSTGGCSIGDGGEFDRTLGCANELSVGVTTTVPSRSLGTITKRSLPCKAGGCGGPTTSGCFSPRSRRIRAKDESKWHQPPALSTCNLHGRFKVPCQSLESVTAPFLILCAANGCIECTGGGLAEYVGMSTKQLVGRKLADVLDELKVECSDAVLDVVHKVGSSVTCDSSLVSCTSEVEAVPRMRRTVASGRSQVSQRSPSQQPQGPDDRLGVDLDELPDEDEVSFFQVEDGGCGRVFIRGCRFGGFTEVRTESSRVTGVDVVGEGEITSSLSEREPSHEYNMTISSHNFFSLTLDVYVYRVQSGCCSHLILRQPLLHFALDRVPLPCFLVHPQSGCVLHWNRAAEKRTGLTAYSMVGWPVDLVPAMGRRTPLKNVCSNSKDPRKVVSGSLVSAILRTPWAGAPLLVTARLITDCLLQCEEGTLMNNTDGLRWPGECLKEVWRYKISAQGKVLATEGIRDPGESVAKRKAAKIPVHSMGGARVGLEFREGYSPTEAPDSFFASLLGLFTEGDVGSMASNAVHIPLLFVVDGEAPEAFDCSMAADCGGLDQHSVTNGEVEELPHAVFKAFEELKVFMTHSLSKYPNNCLTSPSSGRKPMPCFDVMGRLDELLVLLARLAPNFDSAPHDGGVHQFKERGSDGANLDPKSTEPPPVADDKRRGFTAKDFGCRTDNQVADGGCTRGINDGRGEDVEDIGAGKGKGPHQLLRCDRCAGEASSDGGECVAALQAPVMQPAVAITRSGRKSTVMGQGVEALSSEVDEVEEGEVRCGTTASSDWHPTSPRQDRCKLGDCASSKVELSQGIVAPASSLRLEEPRLPEELPIWAMLKSNDEATVPSCYIRVPFGEVFRFGRSSKCHATTHDVFVSSVQFTINRWVPAQLCAVRSITTPWCESEGFGSSYSRTPSVCGPTNSVAAVDWRVELRDCSINGTFVNVKRVGKGKRCTLQNNDLITFQLRSLRFFLGFRFLLTDERGTPLDERTSPSRGVHNLSSLSGRATPHFFQRVLSEPGSTFAINTSQNGSVRSNRDASFPQAPSSVSGSRPSAPTPTSKGRSDNGRRHRGATEWKIGEEMLGKGGNAEVYLGMNLTNGKLIAVKRVPLPKEEDGFGANRKRVLRQYMSLREEIKVLSKAVHPNIVQYYGSSQNEEYFNILLEFVPGGSLRHLLDNFGVLSPAVICSYLSQALEGLRYLHENDIVHSDVKAANILVTDKGRVKLSDFGTAKHLHRPHGQLTDTGGTHDRVVDEVVISTHHVTGTLRWMAPELVRESTGPTKASDIWSVGCALIEMLSGEAPWSEFEFEDEEQIVNLLKYTTEPPEVPNCPVLPELTDIAVRCLVLSPAERPTCEGLLQLVELAKEKLEPQEDESHSRHDDSASLRIL